MLEAIILGMVLDDDLTGYDIKKKIENSIGIFYKASYGSLYPALKRLTEKGMLTTFENPDGGRRKVYYHISDQGRDVFYEWLTSPTDLYEGTNNHLAKVYFFDRAEPEIRERQLLEYEMKNQTYLNKLLALEKEFSELEHKECFYYKLSTLYYGIGITKRTIQWCQHIRKQKPLPDFIESEQ